MSTSFSTNLSTVPALLDRINSTIANAIRWLALIMVIVTVSIVVMRYGLEVGAIGLQESVMYMHGLLFLLGIPYGIQKQTHVRVDLLYSRLSPRGKRNIDLAGHVLFLLPVAVFILVTSVPYAMASWRVLEGSPEVGGIPAIFLLKTMIPVMAVLLLLQGANEIMKLLFVPSGSSTPNSTPSSTSNTAHIKDRID